MPPAAIALVAAGALLVIAAIAWRVRRRRSAREAMLRALVDPDETVRAAAVEVAGSGGISRFSDALWARAKTEPSPAVRERIVEAVVHNQWEPADTADVVQLRVWAQRQLDATARISARPAEASHASPGDAPTTHPSERVTVLVTGGGGPAGIGVVRALRSAGHSVVAVDSDPLAAGLRLSDRAALVPRADDERFVEVLLEVAQRTGAEALVPTVAEELVKLSGAEEQLRSAGIACWIPDPRAVLRCIDKWEFAQALREAGIPAPVTSVGTAEGVPGPWVVKPRFGRGSRDVHLIDNPEELPFVLARVPEPIVQTRLAGREFTVDALVDRSGELVGAVPRWRLETRGGISTKGETFVDPGLTDGVGRLLGALELRGPANIQGFRADDGDTAFVEVNPRFSGGLPLSLAAGADLVGEYLHGVLGGSPRRDRLVHRPGVRMIRHFEEIFEG